MFSFFILIGLIILIVWYVLYCYQQAKDKDSVRLLPWKRPKTLSKKEDPLLLLPYQHQEEHHTQPTEQGASEQKPQPKPQKKREQTPTPQEGAAQTTTPRPQKPIEVKPYRPERVFSPTNAVQRKLFNAGIRHLYFYTTRAQHSFVQRHGIYSTLFLRSHSLPPLELLLHETRYVHLYFNKSSTMPQSHHRDMICFKVSISMLDENTLFADQCSLHPNVKMQKGFKGLNLINLRATQTSDLPQGSADLIASQAEALVIKHVPVTAILNLEQPEIF